VAIAVRFAWIYPLTHLPRMLMTASMRRRYPAPPESEIFIMSWCGMRGIVSLAAALALPNALPDGSPFPERDLIVFVTFVVIAVTLVVQGLTLSPIIRHVRVGGDRSHVDEHRHARRALSRAAVTAINGLAAAENMPDEVADRIRAEFVEKIAGEGPDSLALSRDAEFALRLRRVAIEAERQELIRIWRENQIGDDVLHEVEEQLDYQESRV